MEKIRINLTELLDPQSLQKLKAISSQHRENNLSAFVTKEVLGLNPVASEDSGNADAVVVGAKKGLNHG